MTFEFGSNLDTPDLARLFTEDWSGVRASLAAFHLDASKARPGHAPEPNTYEALVAVDAFAKLKAWGLPLVLEAACLKGWDCYGEVLRDQMREAIANVRLAGGEVAAVAFDEPLTGSQFCGHDVETAAAITANAIRELDDLGVESHLIEPFPHLTSGHVLAFLTVLHRVGWLPDRFVWDLDPNGWGKKPWWKVAPHGLESGRVQAELRLTTVSMRRHYGLDVGVIVIGPQAATQTAYRAGVLHFSEQLRGGWAPADLDVLVVKNWLTQPGVADGEGPRTMPNNFPVDDPTSHLGILQTVTEQWTQ